ncbi:MAG: radical SAM protein [Negativicutes bacterium]|jgi:radical SAM superfamily enzyme YgiQ (UPF0313 family)
MYFGPNIGTVFRPPSEANSFLLRLTVGCSHNKCTFCAMYKDVQFAMLADAQLDAQISMAMKYREQVRRIFFCDGDALVLSTEKLLTLLQRLRREFPHLQRVASYAAPRNILAKTVDELVLLREAGLQLLYFGLETGDEELLKRINKGVTAVDAITAGQNIRLAGIKLSVTIINGLAGRTGWREHAIATARAVSQIQPDMLSALTMMLNRGTEYYQAFIEGFFQPLNPSELAAEMKLFFENLDWTDGHYIFRSNHVSNQFNLAGIIPRDIPRLIADCGAAEVRLKKLTNWNPLNDVDG